ncbi:MAG: STAS domain-containing protein [Candidatus Synoicihabitans palmerolidicus]|nr:STAS domain-containing protein [Candidatus Synoicihabitans palmerolidicus]
MSQPPSASENSLSSLKVPHVVPGDLLSTNVAGFLTRITPVIDSLRQGNQLTLDLRAARLVASVGLNALVTVIKSAHAREVTVTLLVGNANVRRILECTRLDAHPKVEGAEST